MLVLKTGINYSSFNYYTTKLSDLRWPSEIDPNEGFIPDPSLPREITNKVTYSFIDIPILIKYRLSNKSFSPYFELGPNIQFLSKAEFHESTKLISESENIKSQFSTLNVFGRVGLGDSYRLFTESEIFGSLNSQRQLNNLRKMDVSEKRYDYGL
jgi:hypothetical protein